MSEVAINSQTMKRYQRIHTCVKGGIMQYCRPYFRIRRALMLGLDDDIYEY